MWKFENFCVLWKNNILEHKKRIHIYNKLNNQHFWFPNISQTIDRMCVHKQPLYAVAAYTNSFVNNIADYLFNKPDRKSFTIWFDTIVHSVNSNGNSVICRKKGGSGVISKTFKEWFVFLTNETCIIENMRMHMNDKFPWGSDFVQCVAWHKGVQSMFFKSILEALWL